MSVYEYALSEGRAFGYGAIGDYLLEQGADVNVLGASGESPLMGVAAHNDLALCEKYLQKGADIDLRSTTGWTAIDAAAYRDAPDAIQFLISKGAALTPDSLQLAMEYHSYRSANVLAKELKAREIDTGLSPILLAAVTGDSQDVIQRCNAGELTEEELVEVGYYTAAFCSAEALDACVAHGFAICQPEKTYDPIETAAECGNLATVQYMMEQRQEDITGSSAQYALHLAAARDTVIGEIYFPSNDMANAFKNGIDTSNSGRNDTGNFKIRSVVKTGIPGVKGTFYKMSFIWGKE